MVTSGWKYFPPQQAPGQNRFQQVSASSKEGQLTIYGIQCFCMFSETIAVRYAYLFDQPLDVLIQGISCPAS